MLASILSSLSGGEKEAGAHGVLQGRGKERKGGVSVLPFDGEKNWKAALSPILATRRGEGKGKGREKKNLAGMFPAPRPSRKGEKPRHPALNPPHCSKGEGKKGEKKKKKGREGGATFVSIPPSPTQTKRRAGCNPGANLASADYRGKKGKGEKGNALNRPAIPRGRKEKTNPSAIQHLKKGKGRKGEGGKKTPTPFSRILLMERRKGKG